MNLQLFYNLLTHVNMWLEGIKIFFYGWCGSNHMLTYVSKL